MNIGSAVSVALTALRVNALRSGLAALGVIIGVSAAVVMVSVSQGAAVALEQQISNFGANLLTIRPGSSFFGGRRGGAGSATPLTDADLRAIRDEVAGIAAITGEVRSGATVVAGGTNWATTIYGVNAAYFEARGWEIDLGRSFAPEEVQAGTRLALVGQTIITELFDGADPVGLTFRAGSTTFQVIGTVKAKGETSWGQDQDDVIFAPLNTVRQRLGGGASATVRDPVQVIYADVAAGENVERVASDIQDLLRIRRDVQPGADDDFLVASIAEFIRARNETESQLSLLLAVTSAVILIVGGINIMTVMLVSVTERTREIGLRLALGAKRAEIRNQFLVESCVLCVVGGGVGLALGFLGAMWIESLGQFPITIDPLIPAVALGTAAFVGIFFGLYPAHRASRLDPIEALRFE
jgi:putative ABC transport system permease protein